jgi:hypothetical protein
MKFLRLSVWNLLKFILLLVSNVCSQDNIHTAPVSDSMPRKKITPDLVSNQFQNGNPAYFLGLKEGFTATKDEINSRRLLFKKLHPGQSVTDDVLVQMIISEKYLASVAPQKASDADLRKEYDSLKAHLPDSANIAFSDALPFLQSRVLISKSENRAIFQEKAFQYAQNERKRQVENTQQSRSEQAPNLVGPNGQQIKPLELWRIEDLQVRGYEDDCIAFNALTGECVVTVKDYNSNILVFVPPKNIPIDSARLIILDRLLNVTYLANEAKNSGFANLPEVRQQTEKNIRAFAQGPKNVQSHAAINEESLKQLYEKYYDERFSEKKEVIIDIVGSSDSLYVDSLYLMLAKQSEKKKGERATIKSRQNPIAWIRSPAKEVPQELAKCVDTMRTSEFTRPIKTAFGWFIMRVAQINIIQELSFEKAREMLIRMSLAGEERISKVSSKQAENFYKHHKKRFVTPDTLLLRAWLLPEGKIDYGIPNIVDSAKRHADTLRVKPMLVKNLELPQKIGDQVSNLMTMTKQDSFIGPIGTNLGTWYFAVMERKRGGKQRQFTEVKNEIVAELQNIPGRSLEELPRSERETLITNDAIANGYWRKLIADVPDPSEEEVQRALEENTVDISLIPPDAPVAIKKDVVKGLLKDKVWRKGINTWKEHIKITGILKNQ